MEQRVALVTGGSSGIGYETARSLAQAGLRVFTVSRRDFSAPWGEHLKADVTDESQARRAVEEAVARAGRLDVLVNCAGFGISGAVEFTEGEDARQQLSVNFFGMDNMTRAALPVFRRAGSGRVVNVSSVAAVAAIPFQTYYSASKAAINAYTCALANEVRPFGVSVTAVMPGDIRTGFTDARKKSAAGDEVYDGRILRSVSKMERDERGGMRAETAGKFIAGVALRRHVKPLYAIGFSYQCACLLCRLLPQSLSNRLIGELYAK